VQDHPVRAASGTILSRVHDRGAALCANWKLRLIGSSITIFTAYRRWGMFGFAGSYLLISSLGRYCPWPLAFQMESTWPAHHVQSQCWPSQSQNSV